MTTSRKLNREFLTLPKEAMYPALPTSSPPECTLVSVKSSARICCNVASSWAITAFIHACCRAMISRSAGPNGLRSGFWLLRCVMYIVSWLMTCRPLRIELRRHDFAVAHVDDAVAELRRFRIVGDHQDGLSQFLVRLPQHVQHHVGILGVEISRRLVGQNDGRLIH